MNSERIVMERPNRLGRGVKALIWSGGLIFAAMLVVLIFFGISVQQQAKDVGALQETARTRTAQITALAEQVETLRGQLATKDRQIAALAADNQRLTRALEAAGVEVPELSVQPSSILTPTTTVVPGPTRVVPGPRVTTPGPTVTVTAKPSPTPSPTPEPAPGLLFGLLPVRGVTC